MTQYTPPPSAPPSDSKNPPPGSAFFSWVRSLDLTRSDSSWLAGVCSGVAYRLGIDPFIVRGVFLVVAIFGGPALLLYAIAWLILPDSRGLIHLEQAARGVVSPAVWAAGAIALLSVLPWFQGLWWQGPPSWWGMPNWLTISFQSIWSFIVLGGVIWLIVFLAQKTQQKNPAQKVHTVSEDSTTHRSPDQGTTSFAPHSATPQDTSFTPTLGPLQNAHFTSNPAIPQSKEQRALDDRLREQEEKLRMREQTHEQYYSGKDESWHDHGSEWDWTHKPHDMDDQPSWRKQGHLGAGFIAVVLGAAIIIGAVVATINSILNHAAAHANITIGIASALAVVGLGVIVAGIRGKMVDGLGFWAFVLTVATLVAAFLPPGHTQYSLVGSPSWSVSSTTPSEPQGFAMIAGSPRVDLRDLRNNSSEKGGVVDIWLPFGDTTLIVPSHSSFVIESNFAIGEVSIVDARGKIEETEGILVNNRISLKDGQVVPQKTSMPKNTTTVRVWTLFGSSSISLDTRNRTSTGGERS
ncbi:PspC domain-containing protein [Lysinibacter sp. HNR]|uniref:PspC domain-containing protein n=1 Tax=Lysinibacter sp. HNR TaxID=3031408 RepID=UPI0024355FD5|nr:PspC domain-containing protein [Lysinibacter sp. HNR]WGD38147.1 PspC domain-containing protein [Lysinibacter sp. HNR]